MPQITALTPEQFGNKAWIRTGFAFARQSHLVPVVIMELARLVPTMPLVFVTQAGGGFQLMGMTAAQPGSNLFVAPEGQWLGDYIPAVLRNYPFRLVKPAGRDDHILCIDADSGRVVEPPQGEAFFNPDGTLAPAIRDILAQLTEIERSRMVTQAAVDALHAAGLIQPWKLTLKEGDRSLNVEGLFRVDEAAFNSLPDEAFLRLRHSGAQYLAFAQLLSLNQLSQFAKLVQVQQQLRAKSAPAAAEQPLDQAFAYPFEGGSIKLH